jgi:hypothetical protein
VTSLALRRHSHVAVTPTVHEHAGRLLDATLYRDLFNLDPRHPGRPTLLTMKAELERALIPCTGPDAVTAAATLIDAYPQADRTSATYAELVARRLAAVPADLLPKVLDAILDDNPDFRPAPGAVTRTVERIVGKRIALLRRVEAALAWFDRHDAETARAVEVAAFRGEWSRLSPEARAARLFLADPANAPPPPRPRSGHLSPAQLLRLRRPAITQE